ncbi:MAG: hypothetical protein CVU89_05735 [Firmicutes bacterium HGW-Firmicutes-14]|nr:MAG: hypothetical protein CVU89_05735 [Firmicutes bacterium HGW-Firmicutes-14]
MTEKVKRAYSKLNIKFKVCIVLSLVAILLTSFILIASAGSGISFSGQTPAAGTITGNAAPLISLQASAEEGTIAADDVQMVLNGASVTPALSLSSGIYTISHTPAQKLEDGSQSVSVSVYDTIGGLKTTDWSFTVDAAPKASSWYPAKGSTVTVTNPKVSVYVKDTFDNLNANSLAVRLNGEPVGAALQFKGYIDACTETWIIQSYKEGTISLNTSGLPEGNNTVEISIADINGNVMVETWSFKVDTLPVSSKWTPAKDSTVTTASPAISLYVTAKTELNNQSVNAKLNSEPVAATLEYKGYIDSCTDTWVIQSYKEGTIKINPSGLQDGINTVEMSIADNAGNRLDETWSFTVAETPKITGLFPVNGSENVAVTKVSAIIKDNTAVNWDGVRLYINNNEVNFTYNEETGELTGNYNFPTGNHQVKLEAVDMNGNKSTANWSFVSSSSAPDLTKLQYFSNGMTIINGMLKFSAQLNDSVDINDNVTLKLNGAPLDMDFRFKGYTDTCTDQYIITSRKEAYVSYEKKVIDGQNLTLELFAENKYGYSRTWTWTFNVLTPPTITNITPVKYGVTELQPAISAVIGDNDHIASIVMKLNGVDVDYEYDPNTGKLTYIPSEPLSNETKYTVSLTAADGIGLTADSTWKFIVNTYPDMYDGNVTSCQSCHENQNNRPKPNEAIHPGHLFQFDNHYDYCDSCHIYITVPDICSGCHSGEEIPDPWPPHNEYPGTKYSPKYYNTSEPLRVTTNREEWDCIICHQPGAGTKSGSSWWNAPLLNNHDIPQLHFAPLTPDSESCTECHARSLTREHAREGRVDKNGQPITCSTCHDSTDQLVAGAITAKDTSCTACHANADHESLHVSSVDTYCGECHIGSLTSEHLDNAVTTGTKGYSCQTCHVSTRKEVTRSIETSRRNCTSCHTEGHNVYFADEVPDDIPLHDSFNWTTPMEAEIFAGENGVPADYVSGQVVMSNRRSDMTQDNIWNFYNDFLTSNGWERLSYTVSNDGLRFVAEFNKGSRNVLINFFNTPSRTGEGSPVPAGYRLEIWYN